VVLKGLEASEGGTSGYKLMAEASLVLFEVVVVVDLLVAVLAAVCGECQIESVGDRCMKDIPQKPIVNVWLV
jgi:hypothetical protein